MNITPPPVQTEPYRSTTRTAGGVQRQPRWKWWPDHPGHRITLVALLGLPVFFGSGMALGIMSTYASAEEFGNYYLVNYSGIGWQEPLTSGELLSLALTRGGTIGVLLSCLPLFAMFVGCILALTIKPAATVHRPR